VSFLALNNGELLRVPVEPGVYAVLSTGLGEPVFLDKSAGGWFKRKDPTVARNVLESKWVAGESILYIGKATRLHQRLRQYADFGRGKPVGHWGGRYIWQFRGSPDLMVAWRSTPDASPRDVEISLLDEFQAAHGQLPFANIAR
jgi:hypothetical protein